MSFFRRKLLGICAGFALFACQREKPAPAGPAPSASAVRDGYLIGVSQCNLGEPWRVQMNADILKAALAHPELRLVFKDAQNDSLRQRAQVEELVAQHVEAARLAGVPVKSVLVFSYALCGVLAALAGICQAAQETQGDPETGAGYELDAIAMVVLGGTSLSGGRGRIGLTLIGALTLGYLQKVLSLNAYSPEARLMLTGAILIAAVLFQRRAAR